MLCPEVAVVIVPAVVGSTAAVDDGLKNTLTCDEPVVPGLMRIRSDPAG
jgi:hypothetical protein